MKNLQLFVTLIALVACNQFTLFKHSFETGARCIDGSAAGLYFSEGRKNDKFVIYFEGGGLCRGDGLSQMIEYCYQRSFTHLGSSLNYPLQKSFEDIGVLSTQASINPLFHDWNKVFIPYCDGSLHQGFRLNPLNYKTKDLYFRGTKNTLAHFHFLHSNFQFFNSTSIVVSGVSAGGVAVYIWSNFIYEAAQNKDGVILVPDSGMFLINFPNYYNNKTMADYTIDTFNLVNAEIPMPLAACVEAYPTQVQCFQSGNLQPFIKPKMFVIESEYDTWGLTQILQFKCVLETAPSSLERCSDKERAYIQLYRQELMKGVANLTVSAVNGAWAVACAQHGFIDHPYSLNNDTYRIPAQTGSTIFEALESYMNGQGIVLIDSAVWPNNAKCSGLKTRLTREF